MPIEEASHQPLGLEIGIETLEVDAGRSRKLVDVRDAEPAPIGFGPDYRLVPKGPHYALMEQLGVAAWFQREPRVIRPAEESRVLELFG